MNPSSGSVTVIMMLLDELLLSTELHPSVVLVVFFSFNLIVGNKYILICRMGDFYDGLGFAVYAIVKFDFSSMLYNAFSWPLCFKYYGKLHIGARNNPK